MLKVSNCFYTMTFVQKPFYVRCIKPNDIKSSTTFDDKRVGHQVRGNVIGKWFVGSKQWHVTGEIFQPFFFLFLFFVFSGVFVFPPFLQSATHYVCLPAHSFTTWLYFVYFPAHFKFWLIWKSFFIGSWHGWRKPVVFAFLRYYPH